ncbi:ABC transporter ATP-binding protein [Flavobacterium sp. U410]
MSIVVQNISKSFKTVQALQEVSFEVKEGELFGLIGPDGAGKTTLFRILTTLLLPQNGQAFIAGFDVKEEYKSIRNCVGYMPGRFSLYQDLTVEENLTFFATTFGTTIEENYDLIKDIYIQIEPFKNRRAKDLSGGMKQKLALCCALIHAPKVLFLDEPTTGVDPVSRKEFWEMLKRLKQKNITILVSTPYMDEASLCDRIAFIQNGKIFKIDSPQNIIRDFQSKIYEVKSDDMYQLLLDLKQIPDTKSTFSFGESIHYINEKTEFTKEKLQTYLNEKAHKNLDIQLIQATIEDVFMNAD